MSSTSTALAVALVFSTSLISAVRAETEITSGRRRGRSGLAGRVIAGIVVACVVGTLLLLALCVICCMRRRRARGLAGGGVPQSSRMGLPFFNARPARGPQTGGMMNGPYAGGPNAGNAYNKEAGAGVGPGNVSDLALRVDMR
ncbi:hypothetical protein BV25DRAFT_1139988 [Artomyces pyxidatus]|uniref:Uncharacterized protein n=1 Tax=Artomyces pyxidatus TaxID=48021 RepID=A0ACB8SSA4_9AGAM|nr:hypothetical protein BV25DRAFT_1139988 [Artomyces pyxidatus]